MTKKYLFLIIILVLCTGPAYNRDNAPCPVPPPLFTFVQISDTHCTNTGKNPENPPAQACFAERGYKLHWKDIVHSFSILENTVCYINEELKPDFLIHTGDLTENGNLNDLTGTKSLLDKLHCPYYALMGDHDMGGYSYSTLNRTDCNYVRIFGERCRSFDTKGWHIIILSVYPDDAEINWLREDLLKNRDKPVILATHRLVVADNITLSLAKKHLGVELLMPKAGEVEELLKNAHNVKLVLSGHCHSNFSWKKYGIVFLSISALAEVPHQFKIFRVYPDRITETLYSTRNAQAVSEKQWTAAETEILKMKTVRKESGGS